jgi:hypothetical protein
MSLFLVRIVYEAIVAADNEDQAEDRTMEEYDQIQADTGYPFIEVSLLDSGSAEEASSK